MRQSSHLPAMPLWISDYLRDTRDLTLEEHGAYLLLLMHYWERKCEMHYDLERLTRAINAPERSLNLVRGVVERFFTVDPDQRLHHTRADHEWDYVTAKVEQRRAAGRKSAESRRKARGNAQPVQTTSPNDRCNDRSEPRSNDSPNAPRTPTLTPTHRSNPDGLDPPKAPADAVASTAQMAAELVDYLNAKSGGRFKTHVGGKPTEATKRVSRLLGAGFTAEEVRQVIDRQCGQWLGDPKMRTYLRPETLFGRTKFEGYLGQVAQPMPPPEAGVNGARPAGRLSRYERAIAGLDAPSAPHPLPDGGRLVEH